MRKYRQKIFLAGGITALVAAMGLLLRYERSDFHNVAVLVLLVAGLGLLAGSLIRVGRFTRKLDRFLRQLLSGNYEVGISVSGGCRDEICEIERGLEKLVEQLRAYDRLRADRVRIVRNMLDVLQENVSESIMVFDVEKETMECNSAFRLLFGLGGKDPAFAAVKKLDTNAGFGELLHRVIETKKSVQGEAVRLQMRPGELYKDLHLKLLPIKDKGDVVQNVIIIAQP